MTWAHPLLLPGAAAAALLVIVLDRARGARLRRLGVALGETRPRPADTAGTLLTAAAAFLVGIALAGPARAAPPTPDSAPVEESDVAAGAPDVILLLDVSRSMAAADARPDRSREARRAALRLLTSGGVGRVGLVVFAAEAYLLAPPTADRGLVILHLEGADPGAATAQGSDLAAGLAGALDALALAPPGADRTAVPGVIVLFSDGEGFQEEEELRTVLGRARRSGVVVHGVRVGTEEGAPIPGVSGSPVTRAGPATLDRIARATGGRSLSAGDGAALVGLGGHASVSPAQRVPREASAPWVSTLALAALVALLVETTLRALPSRAS